MGQLLAHHLRAWTEEQAGRSAGGMLCVDQGESEDGSPNPGKVCLVARRSNQNVTRRSVIWVGQPPPSLLGMLQRCQAAMLFPGACGPLGLSFPPWGKGQESEQPHRAPGEHPGVEPLFLESKGIIYEETLAHTWHVVGSQDLGFIILRDMEEDFLRSSRKFPSL